MEIIPASEQNRNEGILGWTCYEEHGYPVALFSEAKAQADLNKEINWSEFLDNHKIPKNELKVGMELAIMSLFGMSGGKVTEIDSEGGAAINESNYFPLEYDERRECWVNCGCANLKALTKVGLK